MTWAMAADFEFELAGDGWVEESIQSFSSEDDSISEVVTRVALPKEGVAPILAFWRSKMLEEADDHDVLGEGEIAVGEALGEELKLLVRMKGEANYCHLVVVEYYELAVTFCFVGPPASARAIEEKVATLSRETKFRRL